MNQKSPDFAVHVWGDSALFSRPELSVERYSYDVPTPSAMVGLVKAIYWHPGIEFEIDRIHVLNPIRHLTMRVNEVGEKANAREIVRAVTKRKRLPHPLNPADCIQQRTNSILRDVSYVIEGHIVTDPTKEVQTGVDKAWEILARRAKQGQCYRTPYFGCREHAAYFEWIEPEDIPQGVFAGTGEIDFGIMRHSSAFNADGTITPRWFHAVMKDGVINVRESEVLSA